MIQVACLGLIRNEKGDILAVKQKKDFGDVYFVPGGKLDENESCRKCLKRELREELGVEVAIKELVAFSETSYDNTDMVNLYFDTTIVEGTPQIKEPGKIKEVVYIPIEQIYSYDSIRFKK